MTGNPFKDIKARDLKGRKVRLVTNIESRGGAKFKIGHVMIIEKKQGKLNLACPDGCRLRHGKGGHFGKHWITGVSIYSVELL